MTVYRPYHWLIEDPGTADTVVLAFGGWWDADTVPLSLTGASVQLESPYTNGDEVDVASAEGGSPPYTYAITSQVAAT